MSNAAPIQPPPRRTRALPPGAVIAERVELGEAIAQGSASITYRAVDRSRNLPLVVREYFPLGLAERGPAGEVRPVAEHLGDFYRSGRDRYAHSMRALASFRHPGLLAVEAVLEANDSVYIASSCEPGRTLDATLSPVPQADAGALLGLGAAVVETLEAMHGAGFLHADLRPGRVLVRDDGGISLLEPGGWRTALVSADRALPTAIAPGYCPIERYQPQLWDIGPWTDVYGLSAILYRIAAGTPPPDALDRLVRRDAGGADEVARGLPLLLPRRIRQGILHGLALLPAERPGSVAQWWHAFAPAPSAAADAAIAGELRQAPGPRGSQRTPPVQPTRAAVPRAPRRRVGALVLLILGGLLVLGLAAPRLDWLLPPRDDWSWTDRAAVADATGALRSAAPSTPETQDAAAEQRAIGRAWLAAQPTDGFTLTLYSASSTEGAARAQQQLRTVLPLPLYLHGDDRSGYRILYGTYATRADAERAASTVQSDAAAALHAMDAPLAPLVEPIMALATPP